MSESDKNAVWNTAVTRVKPNRVAVRGYDIADLMGRASFGVAHRAFDGCGVGGVDRSRRRASKRVGRATEKIAFPS